MVVLYDLGGIGQLVLLSNKLSDLAYLTFFQEPSLLLTYLFDTGETTSGALCLVSGSPILDSKWHPGGSPVRMEAGGHST